MRAAAPPSDSSPSYRREGPQGVSPPVAQLGLPVRTALSDDTRIGGPYSCLGKPALTGADAIGGTGAWGACRRPRSPCPGLELCHTYDAVGYGPVGP